MTKQPEVAETWETILSITLIAGRALGLFLVTTFVVFAALYFTPGGWGADRILVVGGKVSTDQCLTTLQEAGYKLVLTRNEGEAKQMLEAFHSRSREQETEITSKVQLVLISLEAVGGRASSLAAFIKEGNLNRLPVIFYTLGEVKGNGQTVESLAAFLHAPSPEELLAAVRAHLLPRRWLLSGYWKWLVHFPGYDVGGGPIAEKLWSSSIVTFTLVSGSLTLSLCISLVLVISMLVWPESRGVSIGFYLVNFLSGFHIVILSLLFVAIFGQIGSFSFWMLPILALGNGTLSDYTSVLREELRRIFSQEYVVAAMARGSSRVRHGARETLVSLINVTSSKIPILVGGTIVLEWVCSYVGLGYNIVKAIETQPRDVNLTMGVTTVIVGGLIFVNFISGALRIYLDPRISEG